jgi:hypothetical protein
MNDASSAVFPKPSEWFGGKLATARPGSASLAATGKKTGTSRGCATEFGRKAFGRPQMRTTAFGFQGSRPGSTRGSVYLAKCEACHTRSQALALLTTRQGHSHYRGWNNEYAADGILVVLVRRLRTLHREVSEFRDA